MSACTGFWLRGNFVLAASEGRRGGVHTAFYDLFRPGLVDRASVVRLEPGSLSRALRDRTDYVTAYDPIRDIDGDGSVDSGDGDTVLAVHAGLPGDLTFGSDISQDYLSYFADGSYSGGAGSIRLCSSDRDLENAWTIHQSTVGRPRISKGASVCP